MRTRHVTPSPNTDSIEPVQNEFAEGASSLRHKCGVFGVFGHDQAAACTALGLHALQHRGQEACGIVTVENLPPSEDKEKRSVDSAYDDVFHVERHLGLVGENFGKESAAIRNLRGRAAVGHNRYSTSGGVAKRNIQPVFAELKVGGFAMAHNGNLTNARTIWSELMESGAIFQSHMDTEVILQLTARSKEADTVSRFVDALKQIEGGYALVCLTRKKLIGARDPWGIRPLILGQIQDEKDPNCGAWVLASESCALEAVGAKRIREIENGEVVVISEDGIQSHFPFPKRPAQPCVFEFLYFARPDSIMHGKSIYEVREELGRQLSRECGVDADLVTPVPDGGNPAALGYAEASGIPFKFGIIRNHYIGRTFIQPTQDARTLSVTRKHAANLDLVRGKRVIIVDDSIVRGTTSKAIVQMMRTAGAKEIHFRVASPPIRHPDYYGIDMPTEKELLAFNRTVEEMTEWLKVDSLGFISLEGFYKSLGVSDRNNEQPQFADHCFTGDYPTKLTDKDNESNAPRQDGFWGRNRDE